MPGCIRRCTSFSKDSIDSAWSDIRNHFGPMTVVGSTFYVEDINDWNQWVIQMNNDLGLGIDPVTDINRFGKWLIWKLSIGTTNNGNLPTRIRDHVGISCIPCPYSIDSDSVRTMLWLRLSSTDILPTQVDHGNYYMRVAQRGTSWGFECTFPGCTHNIDNGIPYFHV